MRKARGEAVAGGKRDAKTARLAALGYTLDDCPAIAQGLAAIPVARIAAATGLSAVTVYRRRTGSCVPAAKHWPALARLAETVNAAAALLKY